ncbi:hypothetical protein GCM10008983_02040 [Lentibacillus halophilus]|uniref:FAD synthase n=1 Tax=Lentibacillus halophilus TaxID=295065 RepID=A0ABN0Z307_9BACI
MKVHSADTLQLPESLVTIGAFDGVHVGHQTLIKNARLQAKAYNVPLVVYTFDPPPKVYFQHAILLTPLSEKLKKLEKLGVDHVITASFDAAFLSRGTDMFINELKELNPIEIWEGPDFRFGRDRNGDINTLKEYFSVEVFEPIHCDEGEVISSTRIRTLLLNNQIKDAQQLLLLSLDRTGS